MRRLVRLGMLDAITEATKTDGGEAVAEKWVNDVRLYYEETGNGAPIACIHGTGSSALLWGDSVDDLAQLGRVITYDRRGCTRSERPETYERTTVAAQADDAAALLEALEAVPAVVIGRSYGGAVATELALRRPDLVRALVLLEPADIEFSPAVSAWTDRLVERVREAASREGVDAAGRALIGEVLGPSAWAAFPDPVRRMFTANGRAILAEMQGDRLEADAEALAVIDCPALVVAATDSPPEFRDLGEGIVEALPNARLALVDGGHLIDPASPAVLEFIAEVVEGRAVGAAGSAVA
jgi:esterase